MKRIVIVGGVAGGATIAARLRRLDETSQIVLFEKGEHISFANCGLPYYIGETIKQREKLLVQTVKGMSERYNIDIRIKSEITKINRETKEIEVTNLSSGETYTETYDYLVLSPGAKPFIPNIKGINEASNIFVLRNIPDADNIKYYIEKNKVTEAAIIGGGFIGLEMAENLHALGIKVTLIESNNKVMPPLDFELACLLHSHLIDKGINLILGDALTGIENNGNEIILNSGRIVQTQMIIMSIGIRPENSLAVQAGLEIGQRGGIVVNNYLQTSDDSIYAVGDAVEVNDYVLGSRVQIPLAWPANRQARLAADNIYGLKKEYKGSLGTAVAKVFDLTAATTGVNEKTLLDLNKKYETVHIHPNSHAGYYPGAFPISLKMTFDPQTGQIFGAQGVGAEGVEKRIDVIATAIKGGLTVFDLPDLELSYAPPYSSAKDPVNMLGYVASNVASGFVKTVQFHEIDKLVDQGNFLLDVRMPSEIAMGSINGSVNIPLDQLRSRLGEVPNNRPVYVTCQVGLRGYLATRILVANGFDAFNLDGGYRTYSAVYRQKANANAAPESKVADSGEVVKEKK